MLAWHFTGTRLRDGHPIPAIGETLRHTGPLILCNRGLHASLRPIDAIAYAPGPMLWRVRMGGEIKQEEDKLVARERTILWGFDASEVLRAFARLCALDVAHLWDMPPVVREYLETGREDLRAAAWAAARAAAGDAEAAWAVDWAAARAATLFAARAAVWAAAWNAVWAATWNAAWDAARAAGAARDAQNERLTATIKAEAIRLGYSMEGL